MRVDVLGPMRAEAGGAEVELGGPQQRLVLALLAEAKGRVVTTDQLVDRVWGEQVPDRARKTIQVHVSKLRKAFGDAAAIETAGGGYRLGTTVTIDVAEFEQLADDAHGLLGDQPGRAAMMLREALELWRGPPYADIRDEEAVQFEASRLEERRLAVLEDRLEADIDSGRASEAVADLESLLERHGERERLHALYMLGLYRSGRQPEALAAFQSYQRTLAEQHGLDPSPELVRLELQILNQDPALGPVAGVAPRHALEPPGLPAQVSSFVGRVEELDALRRLLDRHRLVTITGTGGVGKTRLALALGQDPGVGFPYGVWLVELAALADQALVDDEVASLLQAGRVPDAELRDTIAERIGDREMLLILDNCEHLIDAVAEMARHLLRSCSGLRILATSRARIGVRGEAEYRLPPLALPEPGDPAALATDSARLFVDRATAVMPDLELRSDDVDAIAAICRQLDGIPLAIELAAVRVRVLTPAQIAARLDERFSLLVGPRHLDLGKQQTLEATIEWSYQLLDDDERLFLERLSVFVGGFDLAAAEAVCCEPPLAPNAALDLVDALVDKSMVTAEPGSAEKARYRLLESIRDYASARLADRTPGDLAERHMGHFAEVAAELQAMYRAGDLGRALPLFGLDEGNLRAALQFALEAGHLDIAARIVGAVFYFWYQEGAFPEGIGWCRKLFAADPELPDELLAPALHAYGSLLGSWEQPAAGAEMLERQVALRRRMGDDERLAAALNNLGNLLVDLGRVDDAERALREAIELLRGAGQAPTLSLVSLGFGGLRSGDYERAWQRFADAQDEARAVGDAYAEALATAYLGQCEARLGRVAEARERLEDALVRLGELGVRPGILDAVFQLALVDRMEGNVARAAERLLRTLETPDAHWYLAAKYWILQVVASLIDDAAVAARLLAAASAYYDEVEEVQPAFIREDLAETSRRVQDALGQEAFDAASATVLPSHRVVAMGRAALRKLLAASPAGMSGV